MKMEETRKLQAVDPTKPTSVGVADDDELYLL